MNVSLQIKQRRILAGLRLTDVARAMGVNVTRVIDIEKAGRDLRLSTIEGLARAFGVAPWELLAELTGAIDMASEPRFRGEVVMEQYDDGSIVLSDRSGFILHRFIPLQDKPGRWTHAEERQHGAPPGVREVVAVRPAADAPKVVCVRRGPEKKEETEK